MWYKTEFSEAITPVFRVTWSFRKHSDLVLNKHFLLLSMLKTVALFNMFVKYMFHFFSIIWWTESSNEQHLFRLEIVCNITHFTFNFDQFNAPLLNTSIHFLEKKHTDLKLLNGGNINDLFFVFFLPFNPSYLFMHRFSFSIELKLIKVLKSQERIQTPQCWMPSEATCLCRLNFYVQVWLL